MTLKLGVSSSRTLIGSSMKKNKLQVRKGKVLVNVIINVYFHAPFKL